MEDKIKQDLKIQADKFVSVFKRLPGFNVEENSEVFYEMLWHCVVIGSQLTAERAKEKVKLLDYNIGSHLRGDLLKAIKESII